MPIQVLTSIINRAFLEDLYHPFLVILGLPHETWLSTSLKWLSNGVFTMPGGIFQSQVFPLHLLHPIPQYCNLGDLARNLPLDWTEAVIVGYYGCFLMCFLKNHLLGGFNNCRWEACCETLVWDDHPRRFERPGGIPISNTWINVAGTTRVPLKWVVCNSKLSKVATHSVSHIIYPHFHPVNLQPISGYAYQHLPPDRREMMLATL